MIAISINAPRGYAVISIKGAPTLEEYIEAAHSMAAHENFYPHMHRICDFSQIDDLAVSKREVTAFVEEAKQIPTTTSTKIALVAKSHGDKKIMQFFANQLAMPTFEIFEVGRDALAWVLWESPVVDTGNASDVIRTHRLTGDVNGLLVLQMQNEWFHDDAFDENAPVLWDLRHANLLNSPEEVMNVSQHLADRSRQARPSAKASIVAIKDEDLALLTKSFERTIESGRMLVTRDMDAAKSFLLAHDQ